MSEQGATSHTVLDGDLTQSERATVKAVADFHLSHYEDASRIQRAVDAATNWVARPALAISLATVFILWIGGNLTSRRLGFATLDPPPFHWLDLTATLVALFLAVLILVTQRRADELAERRAQLTLDLALLADKKAAKLIELLEELRHDHPSVIDRVDAESNELSSPANPKTILDEIDQQAAIRDSRKA